MRLKKIKFRHCLWGLCVCGVVLFPFVLSKASCKVNGRLETSVHVVPVLADRARGITTVTCHNQNTNRVKSQTTVYAYDASGKYSKDTASATGGAAMEGRSSGQASASIRGMKRAKGIHKGINSSVSNYVTVNTSWKK